MSSVVINGDTSGAVTLSAPAVAGTVTVTLPATSGTMLTTASTTGISGSAISSGTVPEAYGGTGTSTGYYGFKSRIINGGMTIDQRNAGASVSVTASPYTLDRWKAQAPTGGSVQQITSTITNFINSFKYTSSASNAYFQMGQQIEYLNCYDLQNQTVSISFWAKANNSNAGSTALTVRTRTVAGVNGAAIFAGTASDTSVTITTSAVQYTVTRALPATFGALSLEFVLGANVSGDGFEITGVQLEKGSTATSFDYRPYGTELALCQRYYEKQTAIGVYTVFGMGSANTTSTWDGYVKYTTTKRALPTASINLLGLSDGANAVVSVTSINTTFYGLDSVGFRVITPASLTVYRPYTLLANANAAGYIDFSAEL
jgi:hypothetical protein